MCGSAINLLWKQYHGFVRPYSSSVLYSNVILVSLLHSAANYCSSFFLHQKCKISTKPKDIASISVFKCASVASLLRYPIAFKGLTRTLKVVLCHPRKRIWDTLRLGDFGYIRMPNVIRKSSTLFNSSSYKSSTSSSKHFCSMLLSSSISFFIEYCASFQII